MPSLVGHIMIDVRFVSFLAGDVLWHVELTGCLVKYGASLLLVLLGSSAA